MSAEQATSGRHSEKKVIQTTRRRRLIFQKVHFTIKVTKLQELPGAESTELNVFDNFVGNAQFILFSQE